MNIVRATRNLTQVAKTTGAVLGAAAVTEVVYTGSQLLFKDLGELCGYGKELLNPTIYKVKPGTFRRSMTCRKSRVPGDPRYVAVHTDVLPVNKKAIKIKPKMIVK